jgi:hypothetical protein
MHEKNRKNHKLQRKDRKNTQPKPETIKEKLKADVMLGKKCNEDQLKEVIEEKAYKKGKGIPKMNQSDSVSTNKTDIHDKAKKFAKMLSIGRDCEKPGKIRRMETVITRCITAKNSTNKDIYLQLCRFYPKAKEPTKKVFDEIAREIHQWNKDDFVRLFRMMRIYYEAVSKKFKLEGMEND